MSECKTVLFLQQIALSDSHNAAIARTALSLIEDIRLSNLNTIYVTSLFEILTEIYQETGQSLMAHLHEGSDCDLCAALAQSMP